MVDLTQLKMAYEAEEDPNTRSLLKLAFDLFTSGHFEHFQEMFDEGLHFGFMSPSGIDAFEKVMRGLKEEKEKEKMTQWCVVCALPAPSKEDKDLQSPIQKSVGCKGKGKVVVESLPLTRRASASNLRRLKGKGVKIYDDDDERRKNSEEEEKKKVEEEGRKKSGDMVASPWVRFMNQVLFDYLKQISDEDIASFVQSEQSPDKYTFLGFLHVFRVLRILLWSE